MGVRLLPAAPLVQTLDWALPPETEPPPPKPPPWPSGPWTPHLKVDIGMDPGHHIMRQTPVCPARQWVPPLALTGTMTSDLKFLGRK